MQAQSLAPDLAYLRILIVNVYFYGRPGAGDRQWVLIDTGLPGAGGPIARAAAARFGAGARPAAIVLTHAHFDHAGSLERLASRWDAPVYAHERELPYITGQRSYPPPDSGVGGGMMSLLSPLYPRGPWDVGSRAHPLPLDNSVPSMPGWRWLPTPGHTTGHVSFFRDADGSLVAGDAFTTTREESLLASLTNAPEVHRPPAYFTPDWADARASVQRLAALEPELAATGHGPPLRGPEMRRALHTLADRFNQVALPKRGRYVGRPRAVEPLTGVLIGAAAVLGGVLASRAGRR